MNPQVLLRPPLPQTLSPLLCTACRFTPTHQPVVRLKRLAHHRADPPQASHLEWPTMLNPTPYDILSIPKDGPYTKTRFYQLAKLYHPDRHRCLAPSPATLSAATLTERYRLVVRAHDILSCPSKRRAYDSHGEGWAQPRVLTRETYRQWRAEADSAARNATWEDWARWNDARSGKKQEPVYMSHGAFAAMLAFAISLGVAVQASHAEIMSENRSKQLAARHGQLAGMMEGRAASSAGMGRQERVELFMREREDSLAAYVPGRWEVERESK
ncbi:uncharacterized protein DNG_02199 [Cephalotrichum gorgonifer]|uniref:J domain-containing protein n=1 Tax=Cephalotrichum gorgonifer TaxID=2041049 RepID=A0AAE8SSG2_9PEZI|nr:uncharacterized protein DNG_02199 [Cephalotrichum gorgonifer]